MQWETTKLPPSTSGFSEHEISVILCPNAKCKLLTIESVLHSRYGPNTLRTRILPPKKDVLRLSTYVPERIAQDFFEASMILDVSPQASATLARRCIQAMIRDFCGLSKSNLIDEIELLKDKVNSSVLDGLHDVRILGNIGAHPERDINTIVDVSPDDAALTLHFVTILDKLWYVARANEEANLDALAAAADSKKPQPPTSESHPV